MVRYKIFAWGNEISNKLCKNIFNKYSEKYGIISFTVFGGANYVIELEKDINLYTISGNDIKSKISQELFKMHDSVLWIENKTKFYQQFSND